MDLEASQAEMVVSLGEPQDLFGFYGHRAWWSHVVAWYRGN